MSLAAEILGAGTALPLAVSAGLTWLGQKLWPNGPARSAVPPLATIAAAWVGYAAWVDFNAPPAWRYLLWLGVAAAAISPLATFRGWSRLISPPVGLAFSAIAAWWLVPTWPDLTPARSISIGLLGGYFAALLVLLTLLPQRLSGRLLLTTMVVATAVLAAAMATMLSVRWGQLAGILASAQAGCLLAELRRVEFSAKSLVPIYTILTGGLAYLGCVEPVPPDPQMPWLLAIAALPVAVWALGAWWFAKQTPAEPPLESIGCGSPPPEAPLP